MRCVERRFPFESERLSPPVVFPDWLQQRKFGLLAGSQKHAESNGFKDSISLIYRMKLDRCFEAHDGCVNTIFWNQSGRLLLSGSDDLLLKIWNPFEGRCLTSIRSGHRSNIFNAKFLPFSDDAKIVSCSGDGQLMYTDVLRPETYGSFRFTCHQGSTAGVEIINEEPYSFISCGEDGSVRLFDTRVRTSCKKRFLCNHDVIYKSSCGVSSIAVNQLKPCQMAVSCTDGIVRLMDRRFMDPQSSNRGLKGAFMRFCPLNAPNENENSDRPVRKRITSVKFCPRSGKEVLVSYSGDSLYLFGVDGQYTSRRARLNEQSMCSEKKHATPRNAAAPIQPRDHPAANISPLPDSNNSTDGQSQNRRSIFRRLRIRGDWSDTGPQARPTQSSQTNSDQNPAVSETSGATDRDVDDGNPGVEEVPDDVGARSRNESRGSGPSVNIARFGSILNEMLEQQFGGAEEEPTSTANNQGSHDVSESLNHQTGSTGLTTVSESTIHNVEHTSPSSPSDAATFHTIAISAENNRDSDATEDETIETTEQTNSSESVSQGQTEFSSNLFRNESARPNIVIEHVDSSDCIGQTSSTESATDMEADSLPTYEEQRQDYIRQVKEEVRNAPLVEEGEDPTRSVVFVREDETMEQGGQSASQIDSTGINVYMGTPRSQSINAGSPSLVQTSNLEEGSFVVEPSASGDSTIARQDDDPTISRTAETRWANVTSGLMNMIRAQNRAAASTARSWTRRRNDLLSGAAARRARQDTGGEDERASETEDEDDVVSDGDDQQKKDAEILGLLGIPNAAIRVRYTGHRNTRTMIKQANFWGDDYVTTGSDCGHIFVYERYSGKLVTVMEADRHVVNCVQPHPTNCVLASSGIDYNVKIWAPTGPPRLGAPPHMLELVERNMVMQRQTRDLITVPASFMLRLLAIASARNNRQESSGGNDEAESTPNAATQETTEGEERSAVSEEIIQTPPREEETNEYSSDSD